VCTPGRIPRTFGVGRGVTYDNLVAAQFTGLNAMVGPGTLRDSMALLALVLEQQTELTPTQIMTDAGAYRDVVLGLFQLLGSQFCPRLADMGGARLWRIDPTADDGLLKRMARHTINMDLLARHWEDWLRRAGSLKLGLVQATSMLRTLQVGDRPTRLAQAVAAFGRIDKTLHRLTTMDDASTRRRTLHQLKRGEARQKLARGVVHGTRGEWRPHERAGPEDQWGALGLVVNIIVLGNTLDIDVALEHLRHEGYPVEPTDGARLSPLCCEHMHLLGRSALALPASVARGELRPLRQPGDPGEQEC
jgi:TnpA family transposase